MWTVTKIKDKIMPVEVYLKSGEKHCILTLNHYSIWLARGLATGVTIDITEDKEILTIKENGKYTWNKEVKCCGNCEHQEKCQDTCQYFVCSKHKITNANNMLNRKRYKHESRLYYGRV